MGRKIYGGVLVAIGIAGGIFVIKDGENLGGLIGVALFILYGIYLIKGGRFIIF
jgi:hypothetical protein